MSINAAVELVVGSVGSGVPLEAIPCQTRTATTHATAKSKAIRTGKLRNNEPSGEELEMFTDILHENDSQ